MSHYQEVFLDVMHLRFPEVSAVLFAALWTFLHALMAGVVCANQEVITIKTKVISIQSVAM